jgi:DNA-directed RNA polymerases I, II, and III subunit RPABC2
MEFNNEPEYDEEEVVFEEQEDTELVEVEQTEAQRSEVADLAKLVKQHPEIWIPYEEQVLEQLNTRAPGVEVSEKSYSLREVGKLDAKHRTYPFLTNYERTKILSYRASQICNGAKPYIVVPEGVTDAYEISKLELEAKRLPFIVKRPMPDGSFEVWRLADLVVF